MLRIVKFVTCCIHMIHEFLLVFFKGKVVALYWFAEILLGWIVFTAVSLKSLKGLKQEVKFTYKGSLQINAKFFWLILWSNIFFLMGVVSSKMTPPLSTGHEGSLNAVTNMKWHKLYAMAFIVIRSQPTLMGHFGVVLDSALHLHQENTKWGKIFWKRGVPVSSTDPQNCTIYTEVHWSW